MKILKNYDYLKINYKKSKKFIKKHQIIKIIKVNT